MAPFLGPMALIQAFKVFFYIAIQVPRSTQLSLRRLYS